MGRGTVYLVGAGPGDPKLLTVRGHELLAQADVVVYDHLSSPRILKACASKAKLVYVGKEADHHTMNQTAINRVLIRAARSGKTVVRLKGGDPFLFGRGAEEALELVRARVPYEVVPGVTSAIGVPAYAGIPVTHRQLSSSVALITGHEDPTKRGSAIRWRELATACDTLVFLMGVGTLAGITKQLRRYGRRPSTPCAVIEWGTHVRQRTVTGTLSTIAGRAKRAAFAPPAIIVVGDVVSLRQRLNWFEAKPLFGRRILVTRTSEKAASLSDQLADLGADVEELPAIELIPVKANGLFRRTVQELPKTDWVFFTSPEGIGWFARMLKRSRRDVRWLRGCHIGAIGPKTAAAVEAHGLHVDFVPTRFSQEGIVREFPPRMLRGKRAVIFSAQESRDVLSTGLRARGMVVTKVPIYQTVMPGTLARGVTALLGRRVDAVTVTSASCAEHLFQALRTSGQSAMFRRLPFASIGPVTSAAVRAHGGRIMVEARTSTIEGLIQALVGKLGGRQHQK